MEFNIYSLILPLFFAGLMFLLVLLFGKRFGNTYLMSGHRPTHEKLNKLLKDVQDLDIESKLKVLYVLINKHGKVHYYITMTEHQILIDACREDGEDGEQMMKDDKSIG